MGGRKTVGVSERVGQVPTIRCKSSNVTRNGGEECGENLNYDPH